MAGSITVSSITLDSDNNFSIKSNTGATLFFANTSGVDIANSIGATAITSDKILSIANTKISGNIISSQITSVANTQISGNIISSQITSIGGSQITANTIANSAIQTGAVENYMSAAGLGFGMRNRIINGAMVISQRNGTSSVTPGSGTYPIDRFQNTQSTASSFSYQQVAPPTALAGFVYCQKATVLAARTPAAGDRYDYLQAVEGLNITDLAWGTSSAKAVTASFWVYSSVTGTFAVSISNGGVNRSYVNTYTISSANTWTQVTVTFPGCPDGTWSTDNGTGLILFFDLGCGSNSETTAGAWQSGFYERTSACVKLVNTVSATFYITGVQLEKGSTATSFDYRDYGTELQLCQRYYWQELNSLFASGIAFDTVEAHVRVQYPVPMRTSPTVTIYDNSNNAARIHRNRVGDHGNAVTVTNATLHGFPGISSSGLTSGGGYSCKVKADAEL